MPRAREIARASHAGGATRELQKYSKGISTTNPGVNFNKKKKKQEQKEEVPSGEIKQASEGGSQRKKGREQKRREWK